MVQQESDMDTAVTFDGVSEDVTASGSADFQFGTGDFSAGKLGLKETISLQLIKKL